MRKRGSPCSWFLGQKDEEVGEPPIDLTLDFKGPGGTPSWTGTLTTWNVSDPSHLALVHITEQYAPSSTSSPSPAALPTDRTLHTLTRSLSISATWVASCCWCRWQKTKASVCCKCHMSVLPIPQGIPITYYQVLTRQCSTPYLAVFSPRFMYLLYY